MTYLNGWLAADETRQDAILLRRVFIDMAGGNIIDAVILAQIVYWFTPKKNGEHRVQIQRKDRDGRLYYWLAKTYDQWWDECRVPPSTARDALKRWCQLHVLIKRVFHFHGIPTAHFRIDPEGFEALVTAVTQGNIDTKRSQFLTDGSRRNQPTAPNTPNRRQPSKPTDGNRRNQPTAPVDSYIYKESDTTPDPITDTTNKQHAGVLNLILNEIADWNLSKNRQDQLENLDPVRALGLIRMTKANAKVNPAGLLATYIDNETQPLHEFVSSATATLSVFRAICEYESAVPVPTDHAISRGEGLTDVVFYGAPIAAVWHEALTQMQPVVDTLEYRLVLESAQLYALIGNVLYIEMEYPAYARDRLFGLMLSTLRTIMPDLEIEIIGGES